MTRLTDEQRRAVERRDSSLLVRAGAGSGKTSVLVERFVQAVVEDGAAVDAILAITFTEKAAGEMRERVRRRFAELGRREEARAAEGAWISTIHGFCSRVLRAHALSAGIDPEYRVLDELEAERLGLDAFDRALEDFLHEGADPRRLEMVASYTPDRLRDMVRTAHSRLRSRGQRMPSLDPAAAPAPAGESARLAAAATAAIEDLALAGGGATVMKAREALSRCGELLGGLDGELADATSLGGLKLPGGSAKALASSACVEYRDALEAYATLAATHEEARNRELLRDLLEAYGGRYEALKQLRSGLDFEDLELIARDLLKGDAGLREAYSSRFAHILVDEFQDTNPLQNEILTALERDNLFRVGDEHQSIYGFRNADVEVFREHARTGATESLTMNFRSRGEVLDAIDMAFSAIWPDDFEALRDAPGAREPAPRVEPCVELLAVDRSRGAWDALVEADPDHFGAGMRSATPWRAAEARLLAKRVDELTRGGPFDYGDVVLLMRATTHMGFYERALEERGIPTHVVGGRGYWSQQQVADLRHWLGALANPLDELALYSVLASPLAGVSLDGLALLGFESRRAKRDLWWMLREQVPESLPDSDRRRIDAFVRIFDRERRDAPLVSLETLIDRAVTATGYDQHVLSLPAGDRRMANVRKLMRMAREFEADEGRDLRAFIDFVAERDLIQSREGEAPLEAEQLDAVRLMTIHRAKGLEFPVVCVADLGKDGREDHGALRISADGRLGLRLASIGGGTVNTAELERIREEQRLADEAEERRIFYVAATRAQEHLVLSGATDLVKRPQPGPLCEPMRWAWRAFCPELPSEGAAGIAAADYAGRPVPVRWTACTPDTLDELLPVGDRMPALPAPATSESFETPPLELGAIAAPRALPVSRLSYSGLQAYKRCGYRFYLERVLRLPGGDALAPGRRPRSPGERGVDAELEVGAGPRGIAEPRAADELKPLLRGTLVHELLERLDFARLRVPSEEEAVAAIERHGAEARPDDVADLRDMVERFVASPLCERLGRAERVRAELPFAFTITPPQARRRSVLVNGIVDVHASEPGGTLIVDYKSDPLEARSPAELVEAEYTVQRLVYALAALRSGAERAEVAYVLLERPDEPVVASYDASQADTLEAELLELARGVVEGAFEPTSEPHAELCANCPGQPALCSWGPERTLAR